ncbi:MULTISPECIES: hypothetical protein [unclassified Minwuia]|jgi:ribosomal protein L32|uniref:hypothetical protein n=1 Tax=unclassified Minwuia TaxID=2618799 RepID=UPI0024784348|nr:MULTISPECIES: hypothetical protein [unclassified Minwuia]
MWMKILILVAVVAVVIYGFRAIGGKRSSRSGTSDTSGQTPARENAVNLIQCGNCGAYTPEGKSCSSCGKNTSG